MIGQRGKQSAKAGYWNANRAKIAKWQGLSGPSCRFGQISPLRPGQRVVVAPLMSKWSRDPHDHAFRRPLSGPFSQEKKTCEHAFALVAEGSGLPARTPTRGGSVGIQSWEWSWFVSTGDDYVRVMKSNLLERKKEGPAFLDFLCGAAGHGDSWPPPFRWHSRQPPGGSARIPLKCSLIARIMSR